MRVFASPVHAVRPPCPPAGFHDELLRRVESGEIDPSFVITHTVPIDKGPEMYKTFRDKEDGCIKVVLKPWE